MLFLKRAVFCVLCLFCLEKNPVGAQDAQSLRIAAIPENPLPGEPVSVAFTGAVGANLKLSLANGQGVLAKAAFFTLPQEKSAEEPPVYAAILTVPSTAKSGAASLRVENNGAVLKETALVIQERKFASEVIALDQRNTAIRVEPSKQKTEQANKLWAILSNTGNALYTASAFAPPVPANTRRTGFFGDRRIYKYSDNKTDSSIHAGIDYGVPSGTAVRVCADGKVILAEFREATGNSIVVEHLPGVYSLYYHLSVISVKVGAMVKTNELLGESGATGLATGPHLHWEIRVATENTDPDICVSRPIFDRNALLAKLK
jgi:murein DD-endopeptidase MepM/ murein hydrolase activator NlpD